MKQSAASSDLPQAFAASAHQEDVSMSLVDKGKSTYHSIFVAAVVTADQSAPTTFVSNVTAMQCDCVCVCMPVPPLVFTL